MEEGAATGAEAGASARASLAPQAPLAFATPRLRKIIVGSLALSTIATVVGFALSPYLAVEQPLLLIALSADPQFLILVAGHVPWAALVPLAVLRRAFAHVALYAFAGLYGTRALRWAEGKAAWLARYFDWIRRLFERFGAPLLVVAPTYTLAALAGAAGARPWPFLIASTLGHILWVILTCLFGEAISEQTGALLRFLRAHPIQSTAVAVALVAAQQLYSRWKKRSSREKNDD